MAVIVCPLHGRQYCVFCSSGVAAAVADDTDPDRQLFALRLRLFGENGIFWVDEGFLTANALDQLREGGKVVVTDEDRAFDLYMQLPPVCVRCYEEYLERHHLTRPEYA
jgi:hypothetical protein